MHCTNIEKKKKRLLFFNNLMISSYSIVNYFCHIKKLKTDEAQCVRSLFFNSENPVLQFSFKFPVNINFTITPWIPFRDDDDTVLILNAFERKFSKPYKKKKKKTLWLFELILNRRFLFWFFFFINCRKSCLYATPRTRNV